MTQVSRDYLLDLAERVMWTAAEAALALLIVVAADWQYEWVPLLTTALSLLKGVVARQIGSSETASITPAKWPNR